MVKLLANHGVISLKIKSFSLSEKHGKNSKTHWVKLVITKFPFIRKNQELRKNMKDFKNTLGKT